MGEEPRLSFKINAHPRRGISLARSLAPSLSLSHSSSHGTAVVAITLLESALKRSRSRGAATTYQAYRSQNDLRPLDERDRIERGPGLSAAVRSAVHLSATEAEISKLTQRPSACACVRRYDGRRRRPRGCVRMRTRRRVRPEIPYSHPRPSPRDSPCAALSTFPVAVVAIYSACSSSVFSPSP